MRDPLAAWSWCSCGWRPYVVPQCFDMQAGTQSVKSRRCWEDRAIRPTGAKRGDTCKSLNSWRHESVRAPAYRSYLLPPCDPRPGQQVCWDAGFAPGGVGDASAVAVVGGVCDEALLDGCHVGFVGEGGELLVDVTPILE